MVHDQANLEFFKGTFADAWITQGIWVAAELGIADLLVDGPRSIEELAEKTQAHSGALYRVMRALASVSLFAQNVQGQFSLTPLADFLRSDTPDSQRPFSMMMGAEFHAAWGELLYSIRKGEP
jgi:hypothetical protein